MRDLKNISFKHPRDLLRTITYFLLLTGVVGTSGCATTILFSEGKPYRSPGEFVLTDTIFALGIPDEALSKKIASDSVIFLGKKNTYVLERGGKELMYIGQELDGDKLKLNDISHQLFLEDNNVWGRLSLSYVAWGITRKGKAEIEKLELLGFRDFGFGTYRKTINVRGVVYPPMSIDNAQLQRLKQSRELSFYRPDGPSGGLDPIRLVYLPFALAIDLATAVPQLALIGMNVLVITIKDKKDY